MAKRTGANFGNMSEEHGKVKTFDETKCKISIKPVSSEFCNLPQCPAEWLVSPWSQVNYFISYIVNNFEFSVQIRVGMEYGKELFIAFMNPIR